MFTLNKPPSLLTADVLYGQPLIMNAYCIFSICKVGLIYSNLRPPLASESGGFALRPPISDVINMLASVRTVYVAKPSSFQALLAGYGHI